MERKRQEKCGLTPAAWLLSTLRTAQGCPCCIFTLLSEAVPHFFTLTAAEVKPWRCQWRYKWINNVQAGLPCYYDAQRKQLSRVADTFGHVFPSFIIFWQELEQNPSYLEAKWLTLWHTIFLYLNQAQIWERKKWRGLSFSLLLPKRHQQQLFRKQSHLAMVCFIIVWGLWGLLAWGLGIFFFNLPLNFNQLTHGFRFT